MHHWEVSEAQAAGCLLWPQPQEGPCSWYWGLGVPQGVISGICLPPHLSACLFDIQVLPANYISWRIIWHYPSTFTFFRWRKWSQRGAMILLKVKALDPQTLTTREFHYMFYAVLPTLTLTSCPRLFLFLLYTQTIFQLWLGTPIWLTLWPIHTPLPLSAAQIQRIQGSLSPLSRGVKQRPEAAPHRRKNTGG